MNDTEQFIWWAMGKAEFPFYNKPYLVKPPEGFEKQAQEAENE